MRIYILIILLSLPTISEAGQYRSYQAKAEFKRITPCPANGNSRGACPGYIVDHVKPLACGGADNYTNMQWQTIADAKAKDKWERVNCFPE